MSDPTTCLTFLSHLAGTPFVVERSLRQGDWRRSRPTVLEAGRDWANVHNGREWSGRCSTRRYCRVRLPVVGDYFQNIVDVEATDAEAGPLGERLLHWLVESGIVVSTPSENVLSADVGYGPGPRASVAVTEPDDSMFTLRTNGLHVIAERHIYDPGQGGIGPVVCPWCADRDVLLDPDTYEMSDRWDDMSGAFSRWLNGGDGELDCLHCRRVVTLTEWRWEEPAVAVGSLGVRIWNWPPLAGEFVSDVARLLGHRVVVNFGKL
jgi:hypothetical protein